MFHSISPQKDATAWHLLHKIQLVSKNNRYTLLLKMLNLEIHKSSLRNVKIYFHKFGQFLDLSGRMGYFIYLNESVQNQINVQDLRSVFNNFICKILFMFLVTECYQRKLVTFSVPKKLFMIIVFTML